MTAKALVRPEASELWRRLPLRSVCLETEITDPTKSPGTTFRYVDVSAVSRELWRVVSSTEHTGSTAPSRARKLVKADDVILATVRPTLRRVAMVPRQLDGQVVSTAFCVLRADPAQVDPGFLYYSVLTDEFIDRLANSQRGASYPAITDGDVLKEEILVPPLREQGAITVVLSEVHAAMEVQEKIVATLKELKAATMAKLFREGLRGEATQRRETRFGDVPATWDTASLGEVAYIQTGVAKGRRIRDGSAIVEVPYLRVANVQDGYLDLAEVKTIELRESEVQRYTLQVGDVLLTEGGDFDKLGRGYLWSGQVAGCAHQNHIFAVRTERTRLFPEFFAYLAQSHYGKAYFLTVAHKTTNLASINSSKLKAFPVLLPTLEEQARIAAELRRMDEVLDLHVDRLKNLKSLFSSMLRLLMTGQVRLPAGVGVEGERVVADVADQEGGEPPVRERLPEKVERFVAQLVRRFEPERVVLFGSHAEGTATADSDVDLLVVMPFEGRGSDQAARIDCALKRDFALDLLVRRPEAVRQGLEQGDPFMKEIVEKGKVLYARPE